MIIALWGKVFQHYCYDAREKSTSDVHAFDAEFVGIDLWHALESFEEGNSIFECKDGAYQPLSAEDILEVDNSGKG